MPEPIDYYTWIEPLGLRSDVQNFIVHRLNSTKALIPTLEDFCLATLKHKLYLAEDMPIEARQSLAASCEAYLAKLYGKPESKPQLNDYRLAQQVYLAAANRMYAVIPGNKDEDVSELFYGFVAAQSTPIEASIESLSHFLSFFHDSTPKWLLETLEQASNLEEESHKGIVIGWHRHWVGEAVDKIEARETISGLKLKLYNADWVQEISYSGAYSVAWLEAS